jgi:putative Holliday junction resolvase
MRILGIDPGEKNIGVAISDPSGTIANPHTIINHISRPIDAASIGQIALENKVELIVVGQALDINGKPTLSGRRARRLAAAIRTQCDIPVLLWDESNSTQTAQRALESMGISRQSRRGLVDDLAATVILQSYLDTK